MKTQIWISDLHIYIICINIYLKLIYILYKNYIQEKFYHNIRRIQLFIYVQFIYLLINTTIYFQIHILMYQDIRPTQSEIDSVTI